MRLSILFPHFRGLRLDHACATVGGIVLVANSTAQSARCPLCRRSSRRVHSRYRCRVLERFLQQKRSLLRQATAPSVEPLPAPRLQPWQARVERESVQRHAPWIVRYEQVIALHTKGAAIADIAREVRISGRTVYRYLRLGRPPERKRYRPRRTPLGPYKEHLLRRWEEGYHVATRLWREIRAMGYAHSYTNVSRFVARLRLPVGQRPSIYREHGIADKTPTPRHVGMLFIRRIYARPGFRCAAAGARGRTAGCVDRRGEHERGGGVASVRAGTAAGY